MKKVVQNLANVKDVKNFAEKSASEKVAIVSKELTYKGKYRADLVAILVVIFQNLGGNFKSFDKLLSEFVTIKNYKNSKRLGSNDKTRARRLLSSDYTTTAIRKTEQSNLINLVSIVKGLKITTKDPLQYKPSGNVVTETSDKNSYKFVINKNVTTYTAKERALRIKQAEAKIAKFNEAKAKASK